ncbi:hypothetical protein FIA58_020980, partial [Flavobacterium jejuense]
MKKITLSLLLFFFSLISFSQVPIGNGNNELQQLPFDPFYGYTYSQSIYTSAEINASGNITGLQWYFSGTSLLPNNQNLTIYLGHSTKTAFANTADWEPLASLNAVYTGTIPVSGAGWVSITFDTPFTYNGTDNLIVAVDENFAGYDSSADDFYNTDSTTGRSIWYRSDSTNPDPANPPAGTLASFYPNVIFNGIVQACPQPTALVASNITSSSVAVGWTAAGSETDWEYVIQPLGTGMPTGAGTTTTNNPLTISALLPNTNYEIWVRAYCSVSEQSSWSGPLNVLTLCNAFTAPWTYDVETAGLTTNSIILDCWSSIPANTTASYRWNVDGGGGTPTTPNTGPTGANSGAKYYYVEASSGAVAEVAELYSPLVNVSSLTNASLQFYYHMFGNTMGELHIDIFDGSVWVNDVDVIIGQQQTAISDPWVQRIVSLSAYTGTIQARFRAIRGNGVNGDISLDDISFDEAPACLPPTNLTVYNITDTTIDIDWTENGSAFDWEYVVQPAGTGTPVGSGTSIDLQPWEGAISGLTANTNYEVYIRSYCSVVEQSTWFGPVSFTTECATYSAPFTEGFGNAGSIPLCWDMSGSENWIFSNSGSGNHIGNNGTINGTTNSNGYFAWIDDSTPDTSDATLTSPFIDVSTLTTPRLTFYELSNNEGANPNSTLNVEVWDGAAWNSVATYNTNTVGGWEKKIIDLSSLTITGNIKVRFIIIESTSFYDDIAIDDVTIEETPQCESPLALMASNITSTTADLSWNSIGSETSWNIEYGITGFTLGSGTQSIGVTNPYNLTSLTANTTYQYYVQADCTTNGLGTWSGPYSFTTLCNPYTIPYFEGFESGYTQDVAVGGCLYQESVTATQVWTANSTLTTYNRTPRTGSWNAYLQYGNDDWLFIPIDLVGGTSYTIDFYARQDGSTATNSNITVSYGTVATAAGMTNSIVPATGIVNGNYQQIIGSFTPASSGTYYVGIKGYMNFSPWYISLDDISINVTPACQDPFGLAVSNLTDTSGDITWSASSGSYEYVLDTNASDPVGSGTALTTETYNATGLTSSTTYYFHVRTDCGSG